MRPKLARGSRVRPRPPTRAHGRHRKAPAHVQWPVRLRRWTAWSRVLFTGLLHTIMRALKWCWKIIVP
jgi:hypothetical protein